MKVMLGGADSMSWLWTGFFREHCASLVALCVLPADDGVLEPLARLAAGRARRRVRVLLRRSS